MLSVFVVCVFFFIMGVVGEFFFFENIIFILFVGIFDEVCVKSFGI